MAKMSMYEDDDSRCLWPRIIISSLYSERTMLIFSPVFMIIVINCCQYAKQNMSVMLTF